MSRKALMFNSKSKAGNGNTAVAERLAPLPPARNVTYDDLRPEGVLSYERVGPLDVAPFTPPGLRRQGPS
jgi:hypothetical protein